MSERTFVYLVGREEGPIKCGITSNLFSRLRSLQTGCPFRIQVIYVHTALVREMAAQIEGHFHRSHDTDRTEGEWFNITSEDALESIDTIVDLNSRSFQAWSGLYDETYDLRVAAGWKP